MTVRLPSLDAVAARPWWRYVVYVVGFLTLATAAALGELNALLMATHVPSAGSYGIGSLSDFGLHTPDPQRAYDVMKTWWGGRSTEATSVFTIAHWHVWIDCAFAFLYPALAAIWLLKARARLASVAPSVPSLRRPLVGVYRGIATVALAFVPVLAFADLAENLFERQVLDAFDPNRSTFAHTGWFWALWAAAVVKYLAGLVVVVSALVATLGVILLPKGTFGRIARAFLTARGPLIIVGLFALIVLLDPTGQAGDTIRRWEDSWRQGASAAAFAVLLGWLSGLEAKRVLAKSRDEVDPPSRRALQSLLVGGAVLVAIAFLADSLWQAGFGLVVPGGLAVVLAGLSLFIVGIPRPERPHAVGLAAEVVPALVAAVPPIALGLLVFRAAFAELAYSNHPNFAWLVALGVALQVIGWGSYEFIRRIGRDRALHPPFLLTVWLGCAAVGVTLLVAVVVNPWATGSNFGTLGLLAGFFVGIAAIAYALIEAAEWLPTPQLLGVLRIERIPWFGFFLVWLVLAALLDPAGKYYDVRLLESRTPTVSKETPTAAYSSWQETNANGRAMPLLFVSTSGGGIRAAYWTAIVLECVLEGRGAEACSSEGPQASARAQRAFFAASGVSGGSLGLATYAAHIAKPEADTNWPESRLGDDYLAPTVGWALFVDLPFSLIRRDGGTDRAEVLERGWERSWADGKGEASVLASGLFERWREQPFPLLLLNGTKVQDSCRFETSVLDESIKLTRRSANNKTLVEDCLSLRVFERSSDRYVKPEERSGWALAASEDLVDYLCRDQDVRLSTAALMSARFPYVLSSGRLVKCNDSEGLSAINLVDGGYFDTSAASAIVELSDRLRPLVDSQNTKTGGTCVVPVFLQIDNSYASEPGPGRPSRPWESSVPLQALGGSRDAREANARQTAALSFGTEGFGSVAGVEVEKNVQKERLPFDRVAHIYPRAHPGSKAPLGWTLSSTSMEDLRRQLQTPANSLEIQKVREWFSPRLTCLRVAAQPVSSRP